MGDNRLNVDMSVVGTDGKLYKRSMWLNWHSGRPLDVYKTVVEMAGEAGLMCEWIENMDGDQIKMPSDVAESVVQLEMGCINEGLLGSYDRTLMNWIRDSYPSLVEKYPEAFESCW